MIGLSLGLHDFGDYAGVGFQRPLALVGGVGLALPRVNGHLEDALDVCDGILLGGGRDIDPGRYGQEPTEHLAPTEPLRDEFELELTERALDRGLPILGMCRGDPDPERRARRHARPGRDGQARVGRASDRPRLEGLEGGRAQLARRAPTTCPRIRAT